MLNAWTSANRLVLGQLKTEENSNEITTISELLRILALEGNHGIICDKVVEFSDQFQEPMNAGIISLKSLFEHKGRSVSSW